MSTFALTAILLVRVIFPICALIALGEWTRRREANYWSRG